MSSLRWNIPSQRAQGRGVRQENPWNRLLAKLEATYCVRGKGQGRVKRYLAEMLDNRESWCSLPWPAPCHRKQKSPFRPAVAFRRPCIVAQVGALSDEDSEDGERGGDDASDSGSDVEEEGEEGGAKEGKGGEGKDGEDGGEDGVKKVGKKGRRGIGEYDYFDPFIDDEGEGRGAGHAMGGSW